MRRILLGLAVAAIGVMAMSTPPAHADERNRDRAWSHEWRGHVERHHAWRDHRGWSSDDDDDYRGYAAPRAYYAEPTVTFGWWVR